MSINIILCGVGGQGTILASKLIASAAMSRGIAVKTAETIGMAQRGGSVFSHVRLGDANCPLMARSTADLIIAFEPAEAVRQLPFLKEGGCVVTSARPVVPVSSMTGGPAYDLDALMSYLREKVGERLVVIDADQAAEDLGSAKCLNVVLLGAAARAGELGLSVEDLRSAIHQRLPEKLWELNERALAYA